MTGSSGTSARQRPRPRTGRGAGARRGFSLVELLTVVVTLGILVGLVAGSVGKVKAKARLATCAGRQRGIGVALMAYANSHANRLPPFAFVDASANLPRSGHWAGARRGSDTLRRTSTERVNLGALVGERVLSAEALQCPAAVEPADYFPDGHAASSYCLRLPYSERLFENCPSLMRYPAGRGGLLNVFLLAPGGQLVAAQRVPQTRVDRSYRSHETASGAAHSADMGRDAWLADGFWGSDGGAGPRDWWHGRRFNVLYGTGTVRTVEAEDDGPLAEHTFGPAGQDPGSRNAGYAPHVEDVWRHFDQQR